MSKFWIVSNRSSKGIHSSLASAEEEASRMARTQALQEQPFHIMESVATYRGSVTVSRVDAPEVEPKPVESKPEPRFKVGDRVRYHGSSTGGSTKHKGLHATVKGVTLDDEDEIFSKLHVEFDSESLGCLKVMNFYLGGFEPLPPAEDPKHPDYEFWAKGTLPKKAKVEAEEYVPQVGDLIKYGSEIGRIKKLDNPFVHAWVEFFGIVGCVPLVFHQLQLLYRPAPPAEDNAVCEGRR